MSYGGLLLALAALLFASTSSNGQRITTIQLDGVQYFVSRMNPYSPALNYFLAYQYCRSLGLQLASFESREKSDSLMQYLRNAGYNKYDYWTSGNRLGTDMLLWMSTGTPFNTTFDYMRKVPINDLENNPVKTEEGGLDAAVPKPLVKEARNRRPGRQSADEIITGCVTLKAPTLEWDTDDCLDVKDFICEQTRCYYYNYGSIPVSPAQGRQRVRPTLPPLTSTSASPTEAATTESQPTTTTASSTTTTTTTTTTGASSRPDDATAYRRINLRPVAAEETLPSTTLGPVGSTAERALHFASRKFPEKESDANVVYVTAVGADQTLANLESSSTTSPSTTRSFKVDKAVQSSVSGRTRIARRRHVIDPLTIDSLNKKPATTTQ